ncbi:hypothetical protein AB1L30_00180, partial [Bremerella sp. JC817]
IEKLGAENIIVRTVKPPSEAISEQRGPLTYGLTRDDWQLLDETLHSACALVGSLYMLLIGQRFLPGKQDIMEQLGHEIPSWKSLSPLTPGPDLVHFSLPSWATSLAGTKAKRFCECIAVPNAWSTRMTD